MSNFQRALEIAVEAHAGQLDRAGEPYILHPIRVMQKMDTEEERIVAILHDVVEDCSFWPLEMIAKEFTYVITNPLDKLTKCELYQDNYEGYIRGIMGDSIATKVKLADLEDNMDITRFKHYDVKSLKNVEKYHNAWLTLKGIK